ncbi:PKD domain-containing protein [Pedobacter mendelii]|uniref:PKD domain-containing protein n=1 Tax=Pedobacter mendelii TaxID=1908240 RepID=UPI00360A5A68
MKKKFLIICLILVTILFNNCKKEPVVNYSPVLNFGIYNIDRNENLILDTSTNITIATNELFSIKNLSANTTSYILDFGDGQTSIQKEPVLSYKQPGTYTLTLSAVGENGLKNSVTKKIKVLERVLKKIIINSLNWNSNLSSNLNWSNDKTADVYVEIKSLSANQSPQFNNGDFNGETFYKTSITKNIKQNQTPIEFDVKTKKVLDMTSMVKGKYGFNLYTEDPSVKYLLLSTWASGVGYNYKCNVDSNKFVVTSSFNGNSIQFIFDYE